MAKIIDQYGNPIDMQALKIAQADAKTLQVRQSHAMHPAAGLTPGRLGNLLRDSIDGDPETYLALAEDMEERDLHYAGVLGIRKRQVSGLEISVDAASEDAHDVEAADLVRAAINRDGFEDELIDMLDAIGKGYSLTEILWDTSEKQWMPRSLKWRDPRLFRFDPDDGETPLLRTPNGDQPLNSFQWIYHCAKVKSGLPVRGGIARAASWAFLFKSFTFKDWAIFVEAYGQPLRVGKYGPNTSEADKDTLMRAVASIGSDFAAIMPESMAVEFIKAELSGSHELYEKRSEFLDRQVSKVVLGQTGTTDAIAGGHAVGKTHDGVRGDIEKADARQLSSTLNRDLVRPVVTLNMGPMQAYPKVRIGRLDEMDITQWTSSTSKLIPFGLQVPESFARERLGIPDADGKEVMLAPRAKAAPPAPDGQDKDEPTQVKTASALLDPNPDAIEDAVQDMLDDEGWQEVVEPMIDGLAERLAAANTIEEARAILADHYTTMDVTAFAELLARAGFSARLGGFNEDEM